MEEFGVTSQPSQSVPIPPCLFLALPTLHQSCCMTLQQICRILFLVCPYIAGCRILLLECPYIAGRRPFKVDVGLFTTASGLTGPDCFIPPCLIVSQTSYDVSNYLSMNSNWIRDMFPNIILVNLPIVVGLPLMASMPSNIQVWFGIYFSMHWSGVDVCCQRRRCQTILSDFNAHR